MSSAVNELSMSDSSALEQLLCDSAAHRVCIGQMTLSEVETIVYDMVNRQSRNDAMHFIRHLSLFFIHAPALQAAHFSEQLMRQSGIAYAIECVMSCLSMIDLPPADDLDARNDALRRLSVQWHTLLTALCRMAAQHPVLFAHSLVEDHYALRRIARRLERMQRIQCFGQGVQFAAAALVNWLSVTPEPTAVSSTPAQPAASEWPPLYQSKSDRRSSMPSMSVKQECSSDSSIHDQPVSPVSTVVGASSSSDGSGDVSSSDPSRCSSAADQDQHATAAAARLLCNAAVSSNSRDESLSAPKSKFPPFIEPHMQSHLSQSSYSLLKHEPPMPLPPISFDSAAIAQLASLHSSPVSHRTTLTPAQIQQAQQQTHNRPVSYAYSNSPTIQHTQLHSQRLH